MKRVLVLNRDYTPLQIISWKKAFIKMNSPQRPVDVVEFYKDLTVRSATRSHPVPSVLVIRNRYVKYKREVHDMGNYRKYIYVRDKNTCQYCTDEFQDVDLTVDHVYPRSKGGANSWQNLVTCCKPCNSRKADKLTHEAKMWPVNEPRPLRDIDLQRYYFMSHKIEEEWKPFLKHIM